LIEPNVNGVSSRCRPRELLFRRIVAHLAPDSFIPMEKLPLDRVRWPLVALLASAAMLAAAFGIFETLMHLAPCQMCWWQRYAHFAACGIALVAIVLNWRGAAADHDGVSILLGFTFGVSFFLGGWHALFSGISAGGRVSRGSEAITGNLSTFSTALSQSFRAKLCGACRTRRGADGGYNAIISGRAHGAQFTPRHSRRCAIQPPVQP
jgi:disulfide bond formation protein DsbB